MVIVIVLTVLAVAVTYKIQEYRVRMWHEKFEYMEACYEGVASDNIDLRIQLEDSREAYSRLIGRRAMTWTGQQAQSVH